MDRLGDGRKCDCKGLMGLGDRISRLMSSEASERIVALRTAILRHTAPAVDCHVSVNLWKPVPLIR